MLVVWWGTFFGIKSKISVGWILIYIKRKQKGNNNLNVCESNFYLIIGGKLKKNTRYCSRKVVIKISPISKESFASEAVKVINVFEETHRWWRWWGIFSKTMTHYNMCCFMYAIYSYTCESNFYLIIAWMFILWTFCKKSDRKNFLFWQTS